MVLAYFLVLLGVSCAKTDRNAGRVERKTVYRQSSMEVSHSSIQEVASLPVSNRDVVMSATEIFEKYNSAVFMIFTSDGQNVYQGSGFFISSEGLAVSNYHVFEDMSQALVKLSDGRTFDIKEILVRNVKDDFVVFRIKGRFNYIPVSRRTCRVGEKVYAIGSPKGMENTFSSGEVSQIREENFIQISCPIDHGSSGGALINAYGEAVGITTAGRDDSGANLNFAKDISLVRVAVNRLVHEN